MWYYLAGLGVLVGALALWKVISFFRDMRKDIDEVKRDMGELRNDVERLNEQVNKLVKATGTFAKGGKEPRN